MWCSCGWLTVWVSFTRVGSALSIWLDMIPGCVCIWMLLHTIGLQLTRVKLTVLSEEEQVYLGLGTSVVSCLGLGLTTSADSPNNSLDPSLTICESGGLHHCNNHFIIKKDCPLPFPSLLLSLPLLSSLLPSSPPTTPTVSLRVLTDMAGTVLCQVKAFRQREYKVASMKD